jgi:hypothetical protein
VSAENPPETAETPAAEPAAEAEAAPAAATPPPAVEGLEAPLGMPPSFADRHPELLVGAAFLGGVAIATLLRRRGN